MHGRHRAGALRRHAPLPAERWPENWERLHAALRSAVARAARLEELEHLAHQIEREQAARDAQRERPYSGPERRRFRRR